MSRDIGWENNDIVNRYDDNPISIISVTLARKFRIFTGQWQLDPNFGLPFDQLTATSKDGSAVQQILINTALSVAGVRSCYINNFNIQLGSRIISGDIIVVTDFNETITLPLSALTFGAQ